MSQTVSVAEMKSHLSEYISKSTYKKERLIITKRNKQVSALVNIDDLQLIEQKGDIITLADLQIASIAIANDLILVTGNTKHFKRIDILKIDNWLK